MRYLHIPRPRKPTIFTWLMVAAAISVLLPVDVLGWVRHLTQPLTLIGLGVREPTRLMMAKVKETAAETISGAEYEGVLQQKEAMANEIAALRARNADLERTNQGLTGIRDGGFPKNGRLIPAKVAGSDPVPGRDRLQLPRGRVHGVEPGDWVASRLLAHAGREQGVSDHAAVLARECLIGWVEEAFSHTCRVVLLTDPVANRAMRVRIVGRDGKLTHCVLEGAGGGKMRIGGQIHDDLVARGDVRVGDAVVSAGDERLPFPVVVGRVAKLERNREKPSFHDAVVEPRLDPKDLGEVHVVDLSAANGE